MKILITSQHYKPEPIKTHEIAEALAARGHEVTALVGTPNYPDGIVPEEYRDGKRRDEFENGVHVMRVPLIPRKNSKLGLAANYLSFAQSSKRAARKLSIDYDVVLAYQTSPVTMVLPGLVAKRRCNCPCLIYCCDLWPESMLNLVSRDNAAFKIMKAKSENIYSQADAIAVTSKPFVDYLVNTHGIDRERLYYLPQHGDGALMDEDTNAIDNGVVDFMFMGNMGIASDTDCILEAVKRIRNTPGFKVHFVGAGNCLERDRVFVRDNHLEDIVVFHGRHPQEEMRDYYRMADVCLLTLKHDSAVGLTMPAKLQGYMAAGKPVLGAIDGAAKEVIDESGCGICVPASDSAALADSMLNIIARPNILSGMGEKGRTYFSENFTLDRFIDSLERLLTNMVEE